MLSQSNIPSTPSWAHQQESSPSLTPRHRSPPPVEETPPTRVSAVHDGEDGDDHTGEDDFLLANPYFVQDDYEDSSLVSGLTTVTSANNHRILQDSEPCTGEAFLRKEHNAIRRMMLRDVDNEAESSEEYPSETGSSTTVAVDQAEDMVQQMRIMLDEFNLNNPAGNKSDHEIMGPEEHGVSYYDENVSLSNMIPEDGDVASDDDSTSISEQTNIEVLSHDQTAPKSHSERYRSKYATYRRQLCKARRRRVMGRMAAVTAILTLILLVVVSYCYEFEYLSAFVLRKQEAAAPPTPTPTPTPTPPLHVTKRPRPSFVDRHHQKQCLQQQQQQQQQQQ